MSRTWYAYDTTGSPFAPGSYNKLTTVPGCLNGPVICAIYAPIGNTSHPPFISPNLRQYIANGLANNVAEPTLPLGGKYYVYLKGLSQ